VRIEWKNVREHESADFGARSVLVGRGPGADVDVDDGAVSRKHAAVRVAEDGQCWIKDLGSREGTFVNGIRIRPGEELPLAPGEWVRLGSTELRVLTGLPPGESVQVQVECPRAYSLSLHNCGVPFLTKVVIVNGTDAPLMNARVRLAVRDYIGGDEELPKVEPGGQAYRELAGEGDEQRLAELTEPRRGAPVEVLVTGASGPLARGSSDTILYPPNCGSASLPPVGHTRPASPSRAWFCPTPARCKTLCAGRPSHT
jgi:hypothetical protein